MNQESLKKENQTKSKAESHSKPAENTYGAISIVSFPQYLNGKTEDIYTEDQQIIDQLEPKPKKEPPTDHVSQTAEKETQKNTQSPSQLDAFSNITTPLTESTDNNDLQSTREVIELDGVETSNTKITSDNPSNIESTSEQENIEEGGKELATDASVEEVDGQATVEETLLSDEQEQSTPSSISETSFEGVTAITFVTNRVRRQAASIPFSKITAGTEASRRADAIAQQVQVQQQINTESVRSSAASVLPPIPEEMPRSVLGKDNPVPGITAILNAATNLPLPNQSPPSLKCSPKGNWPELGRSPVSAGIMRELRDQRNERAMSEEFSSSTHNNENPANDPESQRQRDLDRLRERLLTPLEVQEGYTGEVPALVDTPPPERPAIPERNKTRLSKALARLLENPSRVAQNMVIRARGSAFVGGVLNRLDQTKTLGDGEMSDEFASVLGVQLDAIRDEAGISAEMVDQEVQNRRDDLARQHEEQQQAAQMSIDDGREQVRESNQQVADTIAGARAGMDAHTEEVQASMGGENKRAAIESRRDRIIGDINRLVGREKSDYRRAGQARERELNAGLTSQINAYRFATQQDEFQLTAEKDNGTLAQDPQNPVTIPEHVTDSMAYLLQARIAASTRWRDDRLREVRQRFTTLKTSAAKTTTAHHTSINDAGESAREDVRDWARHQLGEETSWLDDLINMMNDWLGEAEAESVAWEEVQNEETAVVASGYVDMIGQVERAAAAGITQEQMLDDINLTAEERSIINHYFNPPEDLVGRDPIGSIAFGLRERIYQQRGPEVKTRIENEVKNNQSWEVLDEVGRAFNPTFNARDRASKLDAAFRPGLTGLGTEEEQVFAALSGLNSIQAIAVRKAYEHYYGKTLDEALNSEMDTDGEENRARYLLSGDQAAADAAALHMAMEETFLFTGFGTERDLVMNTLRNKSPEQIAAITAAYESTYPGNNTLRELLQEELNDWATLSDHDSDIAMAYMDSNTELADAIAIDQSMNGFSWGFAFNLTYGTDFEAGGRDEFTQVTDRIRQEVAAQATANQWDESQFQAELSRRLAGVESRYNERYSYSGSLRDAIDERFDEGPNRDLLNAILDNDELRADAAKVAIERHESLIYASDDVMIDIVERRFDRALEAERRNNGPAMRREIQLKLDQEDQDYFRRHHRYMTGDQRFARQQELEVKMERKLEENARTQARLDTQRMGEIYQEEDWGNNGETLRAAIDDSTSGDSGKHALTALEQGGYLSRYDRLRFSMGGYGDGTAEDDVLKAYEGATREEIAELERRWAQNHHGESLRDRVLSELSGPKAMDAQVAMLGRPMTVEQSLQRERLRVHLEQPAKWFGGLVAGPEREIMGDQLRYFENKAEQLRQPVTTEEQRRERDRTLDEFTHAQEAVGAAVKNHRSRVAAITDSVANAASMAVAVVAGAVLTFFSGGAAGPVVTALIASLAATMTSVGTKALLMGNQYGHEQIMTDVGIGIVDAMVAVATAGIGNRLLGLSQVGRALGGGAGRSAMARISSVFARLSTRLGDAGVLARRVQTSQLLSRMVQGPFYQKAAAHIIAESVENAVGALPTAIVGEVINDQNWAGGFQMGRVLTNVGTQVGMGVVTGLGMSGGMYLRGKAYRHVMSGIRGPRISGDLHYSSADHLPRNDAQMNAAFDIYSSQSHADGLPRSRADFDAMIAAERQRHFERFQRQNRDATEADFDTRLQERDTALRTEFEQMYRGRKDFDAEAGRESGEQIQRMDSEQRQRDAVSEQLRQDAPEGRRDLGDVPVTVLSEAEFKRLGVDGDSTVIMRDGQAYLVVKEGAELGNLSRQAQQLADMTAAGTAGRSIHAADALPSNLRGKVNVHTNPNLAPRSVQVHYESHNGVIIGVWVEVGLGARVVDIQMHAGTIRSMRRLQGMSGRVRNVVNRMRRWAGANPPAPPGTKAFEAQLEVDKLPGIIRERANALRNANTPEEQARLAIEIEHLQAQLEHHAKFVDAIEADPGMGYVAADALTDQQIANRLADKIEHPDIRAVLADLPAETQQHFLHYPDLINQVTRGHDSPAQARAALSTMVESWQKIRKVADTGNSGLAPRLMRQAAKMDEPATFLNDVGRLADSLDDINARSLLGDISRMRASDVAGTSVADVASAAASILRHDLPADIQGKLIKSAVETKPAERVRALNAIERIASKVDENNARAIAAVLEIRASHSRLAVPKKHRAQFLESLAGLVESRPDSHALNDFFGQLSNPSYYEYVLNQNAWANNGGLSVADLPRVKERAYGDATQRLVSDRDVTTLEAYSKQSELRAKEKEGTIDKGDSGGNVETDSVVPNNKPFSFSGGKPTLANDSFSPDLVNQRSSEFYSLYGDNPVRGTLSIVDARKWYLQQEANIPNLLDTSQPLGSQAKQAFDLRNQFRTDARVRMQDRITADRLFREETNLTFDNLLIKTESKLINKYGVSNPSSDQIFEEIINSSQRSRQSVNKRLGL